MKKVRNEKEDSAGSSTVQLVLQNEFFWCAIPLGFVSDYKLLSPSIELISIDILLMLLLLAFRINIHQATSFMTFLINFFSFPENIYLLITFKHNSPLKPQVCFDQI
jgi:hypothetical protein